MSLPYSNLPLLPIMDRSYPASRPGTTLCAVIPAELFRASCDGWRATPSFPVSFIPVLPVSEYE